MVAEALEVRRHRAQCYGFLYFLGQEDTAYMMVVSPADEPTTLTVQYDRRNQRGDKWKFPDSSSFSMSVLEGLAPEYASRDSPLLEHRRRGIRKAEIGDTGWKDEDSQIHQLGGTCLDSQHGGDRI